MPRILLVDDEDNVRRLYQLELEDEGHEVVSAATGEDALRHVERSAFDLVLLDIKLERESGLDVLRRIKEMQPGLSVILNSGYTSYRDDFSSWLADAYLVKGSDTRELFEAIRGVLEARTVG